MTRVPGGRPGRRWRGSPTGARWRCWSAGPGSTCGRSSTTSPSRAVPRVAAELAGRARRPRAARGALPEQAGCCRTPRAAWRGSTRWPPAASSPGNERRLVRALEVTLGSGRPFSVVRPGPGAVPAEPRSTWSASHRAPTTSDRRDRRAVRPADGRRAPRGGARRWPRARPGCRGRPARPSATGSCSPTWRTACRWPRRSTRPSGAPGPSPGASGRGSGVIPGSCGSDRRRPGRLAVGRRGRRPGRPISGTRRGGPTGAGGVDGERLDEHHDHRPPPTPDSSASPSTTVPATTSWSRWTRTAAVPCPATWSAPCATAGSGWVPTG